MKTSVLKGTTLTTPQVLTGQRLKECQPLSQPAQDMASGGLWKDMPTNANINLKGSEIISRCPSSLTNLRSQKMFVAQENGGLSFSDLAVVAVLAFLCAHQNLFCSYFPPK